MGVHVRPEVLFKVRPERHHRLPMPDFLIRSLLRLSLSLPFQGSPCIPRRPEQFSSIARQEQVIHSLLRYLCSLEKTPALTTSLGAMDPTSTHGGGPVLRGTKWGANLWVWNDVRYGINPTHESKGASTSVHVKFTNDEEVPITLLK